MSHWATVLKEAVGYITVQDQTPLPVLQKRSRDKEPFSIAADATESQGFARVMTASTSVMVERKIAIPHSKLKSSACNIRAGSTTVWKETVEYGQDGLWSHPEANIFRYGAVR